MRGGCRIKGPARHPPAAPAAPAAQAGWAARTAGPAGAGWGWTTAWTGRGPADRHRSLPYLTVVPGGPVPGDPGEPAPRTHAGPAPRQSTPRGIECRQMPEPEPQGAMEPLEFLHRHPPFDRLGEWDLRRVEDALEISFAPRGEVVLRRGAARSEHLFVVRKGSVRLERDGQLLRALEV